jgi:hypothetical protein
MCPAAGIDSEDVVEHDGFNVSRKLKFSRKSDVRTSIEWIYVTVVLALAHFC